MTTPKTPAKRTTRSTVRGAKPAAQSAEQEYRAEVAAYVAAGGDETVQRVVGAVHGLARALDQWYTRQLADLDLSAGEWAVLSQLARSNEDEALTPTQLAEMSRVAPSSMTHRLDRMAQRNLVARATDPSVALPGTIRGDFGRDWGQKVQQNIVHGSDSTVSSAREIGIWFPELV